MKHAKLLLVLMCLMALNAQAQTKFCNSYAEYKTNQWKPYADLIPEKEPDSIRVKYDGQDFTLKTSDKEVNKVIKHDVFMMQIDKQLFINQRFLRDEDGVILPVNNYLRALPYKGNKLCVVSYHVTMGDVLDLVNIGLDIAGGLAVRFGNNIFTASIPLVGVAWQHSHQNRYWTVEDEEGSKATGGGAKLNQIKVARNIELLGLQVGYIRYIPLKKR